MSKRSDRDESNEKGQRPKPQSFSRRTFLAAGSGAGVAGLLGGTSGTRTTEGASVAETKPEPEDIVLENREFRLIVSAKGHARSLLHKGTGQECLDADPRFPMFTVTQYRPYDGEVQLAYPCKPKTFRAREVRREGDLLLVDFELIDHRLEIRIKETDSHIGFSLEKARSKGIQNFWVQWKKEPSLLDEVCFIQLPVKDRENFGEWLNAIWDRDVAVNLLATDPYPMIDGLERRGHHILHATAMQSVKLEGVGAALIVTDGEHLLDRVAQVEADYGLPKGVESRRRAEYSYSYYWVGQITPENVDTHIDYARRGGFRSFMIYYTAFSKTPGHYQFKPDYPRGMDDLKEIVGKIRRAGMIPGLHHHYNKTFGMDPYITPVPDPRLNIRKRFTLVRDLNSEGDQIEVDENPEWSDLESAVKFLRLGNELIEYRDFTITRPFLFRGCRRGIFNTRATNHPAGESLGLLGETAGVIGVYDQRTSIQEEVAKRLGKIYQEAGFEFAYFDGAEDVPPPYWYNVSRAQWLVWKEMEPKPLFSEGACKSHFSWHILTRGNAFDIFLPEVVKKATRAYAGAEAPRIAKDFTGLNFGWVGYWAPSEKTIGSQPDMLEYVTSRAAGWNSPISFRGELKEFQAHPRTQDNLEVLKRWEEVRVKQWLKTEDRQRLRDWDQEHILLVNETGQYELREYGQIDGAAGGNPKMRAFILERRNSPWVVYWHSSGEGRVEIPAIGGRLQLFQDLTDTPRLVETKTGKAILPVSGRRYLRCEGLSRAEAVRLFTQARLL